MNDLEIPERAINLARAVYNTALMPSEGDGHTITRAIQAAAPIIVAAELRRIAIKGEILERPYQVYEAIWKRARELDPEVW